MSVIGGPEDRPPRPSPGAPPSKILAPYALGPLAPRSGKVTVTEASGRTQLALRPDARRQLPLRLRGVSQHQLPEPLCRVVEDRLPAPAAGPESGVVSSTGSPRR